MKPPTLFLFLSILAGVPANDHPQMVSRELLEGVTQPFLSSEWRTLKESADKRASERKYREALREYGVLIRHSTYFGQMPSLEKYDTFISMSRLLREMGFYKKAEILLYEAMSYSSEPYEAHQLLGLLFLEREDIEKSKMHLKNCLFYRETDTVILIYLSTILFAEGKVHETKFYVSRILKALETKLDNLSNMLAASESGRTLVFDEEMSHVEFFARLEDLIVKVFHAQFNYIPSATTELFRFFNTFFIHLSQDDLKGRFIFDLGQALYEHGKSVLGKRMMMRGWETRSKSEGIVSEQVMKLRTHFDYPVVPTSVSHILENFFNITHYLFELDKESHTKIELENCLDTFWSFPLLAWSGMPVAPVLQGIMKAHFFESTPFRNISNQLWVKNGLDLSSCFTGLPEVKPSLHSFKKENKKRQSRKSREAKKKKKKQQFFNEPLKVELGVLGGHFNSHAIGHVTLTRVLQKLNRLQTPNRFGHFSITLLALPLIPDKLTREIARYTHSVVNLPADAKSAIALLDQLQFDVLLFPDWQPFPDQQSIFFRALRVAPVQICYYVRGSSCASAEIDYYLIPQDIEDSYFQTIRQNERFFGLSPPDWMERWIEQPVILDWPVFTPTAIRAVADFANDVSHGSSEADMNAASRTITDFVPRDIEGDIFFDNQAVAVIPFHPSYVHPLMDASIFQLLRSVPHLQVVIALPETYAHVLPSVVQSFAEDLDSMEKLSMQWSKQLIRRLWSIGPEGSSLHQRIRLLPSPLPDKRLLQLIKRADLVLDSFPVGGTLHPLSLALSTGTPIVTMSNGVMLRTASDNMSNPNMFFKNLFAINESDSSSINSIPWLPTASPLSALYSRWGLDKELVASNTQDYVRKSVKLVTHREEAYQLRVRILGILEKRYDPESAFGDMRDLSRFLRRVGIPWADARRQRMIDCS